MIFNETVFNMLFFVYKFKKFIFVLNLHFVAKFTLWSLLIIKRNVFYPESQYCQIIMFKFSAFHTDKLHFTPPVVILSQTIIC